MRGQTVVLDSSNLAAVIADATGEPPATEQPEVKEEVKVEAKEPEKTEIQEDEDDNGLTEAEKKELTAKMQKAIGKKHRALKEAEEFAESQYSERILAEKRAERLERELARFQTSSQNAPQTVANTPSKPVRADFQTDEDYQNALIDYRVEEKIAAREQEQAKKREQERLESIRMEAAKRVDAAKELIPDFEEVLGNADVEIPSYVASYMQESELLPELAYFLANNPERMEKIRKMSPANALVEIGKIESKLEPFGQKTETKVVTSDGKKPSNTQTALEPSLEKKPRAEAPIVPISQSTASQVKKPNSEMTYAEAKADWARSRNVALTRRQRH